MNWIKENKIRIIMIAVALLAVIGTVIVVTRRSGKAQTTDNNQSDVVINESSKEDVTTKKDGNFNRCNKCFIILLKAKCYFDCIRCFCCIAMKDAYRHNKD